MNTSELIALGSFLGACLAALYARWTWREARRANAISVHGKRLEIYKAFDALRFAMLQRACGITHKDTGKFYYPSRESEFYFTSDLQDGLNKYFQICFELAELHKKTQNRDLGDEKREQLRGEQDRLLSEEAALSKEIDGRLRRELKIAR